MTPDTIQVQQVRSKICDAVLIGGSLLAVPGIILLIYRGSAFGWQASLIIQIAFAILLWAIALLRKHVPYAMRAGLLCAIGYAFGLAGVGTYGVLGAGMVWFAIMPLFIGVLFGRVAGWAGLGFSLLAILTIAIWHVYHGKLPPVDLEAYLTSPTAWINVMIVVLAGGAVTLGMTDALTQSLAAALHTAHIHGTSVERSERTYRELVDHMPEIVYAYSAARGYIYFSPAAERAFGYTPDALLAQPRAWLEHVHPDDRERLSASLEGGGDGEPFDLQYRVKTAQGNWHWCRDKSISIRREDEEFIISGLMADVTKDRQREAELQQAQKMEAVGQLTGGIAHDFNNLLTIIQGNLELLSDEMPAAPDGDENAPAALDRKFIDTAMNACSRGAQLAHRLLAFSRRQTLVPEVVDASQLVDSLLELMQRTIGATIDIEVSRGADLWSCRADPAQLESAILNLAINARDAMPGGGKLAIRLENAFLDDEYAAAAAEVTPGLYVLISVTDTGSGIPGEVLERVFEPFFTTKDVGKGSGLGLSMVYGFAKQSGGHVSIYSEEGHGTMVKLYLPRVDGGEASQTAGPKTAEPLAEGETVLVVEDEQDVRTLVVAVLSSLGYTVLEARSGAAALALLHGAPHIDMLLTDMVLPGGMGGPGLAKRLRRQYPDLPVLYMSGFAPDTIAKQHVGEDMELINKPFKRADLARRVRTVLEKHRHAEA